MSTFSSTPGNLCGQSPIVADVHAHTHHSHGQASTEDMFAAACAKGLTIFGFSEHSPRPEGYTYPSDYQDKLIGRFPAYVQEVQAIMERGAHAGVTVLLGLEADYIPGQEAFAKQLCGAYPFDYIIGGLHFQKTWGFDHSVDDWASLSQEERFAIYAQYYRDLTSMCQSGLFNIAAHPDLIKLFTVDSFHSWLSTGEALPLIKTALTALRDNSMLMEVSSAGLRKPCNEIYPCPQIMQLAADLDVSISFGSDAHCTNTPAYAFDVLARYAHSYGYRNSSVFIQGKVRELPFDLPAPLCSSRTI